ATALQSFAIAAQQSSYPAAMATTRPIRIAVLNSMLLTATHGPENMMVPRGERSFATHFRVIANRRAAAILLALRLYALDHDGRLPEALEELVPKYLPQLPADPF